MRELPVGTAYAVWTGIGAAGTATLGMVMLGEPATGARIACLLLIVAGLAGLKLASAGSPGDGAVPHRRFPSPGRRLIRCAP